MEKEGEWFVHSELDPRWNNQGRGFGNALCVPEMEDWIDLCKKEYGAPPKDATKGFYKD